VLEGEISKKSPMQTWFAPGPVRGCLFPLFPLFGSRRGKVPSEFSSFFFQTAANTDQGFHMRCFQKNSFFPSPSPCVRRPEGENRQQRPRILFILIASFLSPLFPSLAPLLVGLHPDSFSVLRAGGCANCGPFFSLLGSLFFFFCPQGVVMFTAHSLKRFFSFSSPSPLSFRPPNKRLKRGHGCEFLSVHYPSSTRCLFFPPHLCPLPPRSAGVGPVHATSSAIYSLSFFFGGPLDPPVLEEQLWPAFKPLSSPALPYFSPPPPPFFANIFQL